MGRSYLITKIRFYVNKHMPCHTKLPQHGHCHTGKQNLRLLKGVADASRL